MNISSLILPLFALLPQIVMASYVDTSGSADYVGKNIDCGGYARLGYLRSSLGSAKTLSANALGGKLSCGLSLTNMVALQVGLFASLDSGLNYSNDGDSHGYLLLGEADMGRQRLEAAHMDSDDSRMGLNFFEGYTAELLVTGHVQAGVGYVRRMSGWGNGGDQADDEIEALDLYLTHQWHKAVSTDVVYAAVNDKNGSDVGHQHRTIVTVSYGGRIDGLS